MSVTLESATTDLIAAIDAATHEWLVRCVMKTYVQQLGTPRLAVEEKLVAAAQLAAQQGRAYVAGELLRELSKDVDEQRINPLQVLRNAVTFPTRVLQEFGVPPTVRDEMDARMMPDDVFGLSPAHWNDVHESLLEPGVIWGAAKAHKVLQRRREEGKLDKP
ncbi:hypothetical protein HQ459_04025 [bacterium]|jgi:hypothetical protein|nr:hypothetical protein [bacterium]